ncbi:hypothetical protein [Promicromonospora sp. NPDC059942]|uniref:hypothetical protein n=1 Tax=Promicromonospora sp. NPDC059942 TaxID=3347009 RepID=UPI00365F2E76
MVGVSVAWEHGPSGRVVCAKLAADSWEINVRGARSDLTRLTQIREADWLSRRSLRAGLVAGAPVFWSFADGQVSLLVGEDDEVWDVAVSVPVEVVDELAQAVGRLAEP